MRNGILLAFGLSGVLLSILYFWLGWPHRWWEIATLVVIVLGSALILLNVISALMEAAASELSRTTQEGLEQYFTSALAGGLQITSSPLHTRPLRLHVAATRWAQERGTLQRASSTARTDAPAWDDFLPTLRGAASYKASIPIHLTWAKVFTAQDQLLIELPVERIPSSNDTVILEFGTGTFPGPTPRPPLVLGTAAFVAHDDTDEVSIWLTADSVIRALGPEVELDE